MTTARVTELPLRLEAVTEDPFGDFEPAAASSETRLRAIQLLCPERRHNAIVD